MPGDGGTRALSDLFSLLGQRRAADDQAAPETTADEPAFPTKALHRFLSSLASRSAPVLLDLGPVVGPNLTFFGEQLGCKIFIEDLFRDLDQHIRQKRSDFRRQMAASTGFCAGTSSTISIARAPRCSHES